MQRMVSSTPISYHSQAVRPIRVRVMIAHLSKFMATCPPLSFSQSFKALDMAFDKSTGGYTIKM